MQQIWKLARTGLQTAHSNQAELTPALSISCLSPVAIIILIRRTLVTPVVTHGAAVAWMAFSTNIIVRPCVYAVQFPTPTSTQTAKQWN